MTARGLQTLAENEEAQRAMLEGHAASVWTALPGIVTAFRDNSGVPVVDVQPGIQARVTAKDGGTAMKDLPVLLDCPVCFLGGGGMVATFGIAPGDEALVVFASRNIDGWFQSGASSPPPTMRMHDLSDGFAFVGFRSAKRPLALPAVGTMRMQKEDGSAFYELTAGGAARVVAPAGFSITSPSLTHNGVNVGATHRHTGVQSGGATSGPPAG